jgi:hypothetical protein
MTTARRQRFLAEASRILAESMDYEATLRTVARLAVPDIADWCVVDLLQSDGSLARVAIEHRDPVRRSLALRLQQEFPPRADAPAGPSHVTRTGTMEFETHVPDAVLREIAPEPERLRILSGLAGRGESLHGLLAARRRHWLIRSLARTDPAYYTRAHGDGQTQTPAATSRDVDRSE